MTYCLLVLSLGNPLLQQPDIAVDNYRKISRRVQQRETFYFHFRLPHLQQTLEVHWGYGLEYLFLQVYFQAYIPPPTWPPLTRSPY